MIQSPQSGIITSPHTGLVGHHGSLDFSIDEIYNYLTDAEKREIDELLRKPIGLKQFAKAAWKYIEPGTPFIDGWHISAICEHLEACFRREIRNLIINMPPRHMKSILVSVMWFCWGWTIDPTTRWLFSSYGGNLAIRDSLKCRAIIQSPWYKSLYGHLFRMAGDQNAKGKFENDKRGFRLATGVAGIGTGEGGDFIAVDDPHKVQEAESDVRREEVSRWWNETMGSRGNNPLNDVRVIVMQRVHHRDLTGEVLARDLGYDHLCLPMRFENTEEARSRVTSIGFRDPRTTDGELLWPQRIPESAARQLEKRLGAFGTAGQLQQRPQPREGQQFERHWFEVVEEVPREGTRVLRWDVAATEGGGDYTVGVLFAYSPKTGLYYVENILRGQWRTADRDKKMMAEAERCKALYGRNGFTIVVPQDPGSAGLDQVRAWYRLFAGYRITRDKETGKKEVRASPLASQAEALNVKIKKGLWNEDFLQEFEMFPRGANDDQVDATAGAFNIIARNVKAKSKKEPP